MKMQKSNQQLTQWQVRLVDLLLQGGYQSSWWCGFSGTKWTEVLYLDVPHPFKATIWLEFADPTTCSGPMLGVNADWYRDSLTGEWMNPAWYLERDFIKAETIAYLFDLQPWSETSDLEFWSDKLSID